MVKTIKYTVDELKNKFIEIHGDLYDYQEFMGYTNIAQTKIPIICKKHGIFYQRIHNHLSGTGCKQCNVVDKSLLDETFIIHEIQKIYNQQITLMSKYGGKFKKAKFNCKTHGNFEKQLHLVMLGHGCPQCLKVPKIDVNFFKKQAIHTHGNLYKYEKVEYKNAHTKVVITCNIHGDFIQTPDNHLRGKQGCPNCSTSISKLESKWLDDLGIPKSYRQKFIKTNTRERMKVDAYDQKTKTVYEFFGDFWHGNPVRFPTPVLNPKCKIMSDELYRLTIERITDIKNSGYNLIYIWENDYLNHFC